MTARTPPTILIAGAGPGGLTLANLALRQGFKVVLIERSATIVKAKNSLGGGIGLWVNSLRTLEHIPRVLSQLKAGGLFMPSPAYRDSYGSVLAAPLGNFGSRFPVLSLERETLLQALVDAYTNPDETELRLRQCNSLRTGVSVDSYSVEGPTVTVKLSDQTTVSGDLLVACDGLWSTLRGQMLADHPRPPLPVHCGYVYFRACVDVAEPTTPPSGDGASWHSVSFEAWSKGVRVGYVPLKRPAVFWFISVPSMPFTDFAPKKGVHSITDQLKQQLLARVAHFTAHGPVNIPTLIEMTPTASIVQTDIFKLVDSFPWKAHDGRVLLLGDAAHAIAPNLAMGAGISIEDAADLAYLLSKARPIWNQGGLQVATDQYQERRKHRAYVVQRMADVVAVVGQLESNVLIVARNGFMRLTRLLVPWLQSAVFERVVAFALGMGPFGDTVWNPPPLSPRSCLLARCLSEEDFNSLSLYVRKFKSDTDGGQGHGTVSVSRGDNVVSRLLATIAGLPEEMSNARFLASVVGSQEGRLQTWTRVFGYGTAQAAKYSTTHSLVTDSDGSGLLSEGVGGLLDSVVRFGYKVRVAEGGALKFDSVGMWLFGWRLPLPSWLCLRSKWTETPTELGWRFAGEISAPLLGKLMGYHGDFVVEAPLPKSARAIVCGGTGLVGRAVCSQLALDGFEVVLLSKSQPTSVSGRFPVVHWDARTKFGWSGLIDSSTVIINLAGENPGVKRWTAANKKLIEQSRLDAIAAVGDALAEAKAEGRSPRLYIQASAAGIYGHRGGEPLDESSSAGPETDFRVSCCVNIEKAATAAADGSVPVAMLRIGHVLALDGGFFPYVNLASRMRAGRLGSGEQHVPWVHIRDVAHVVSRLASGSLGEVNGPVVVAAPVPATNAQVLSALATVRGRLGCVVPVPETALRIALGESSSVVLDSQKLVPKWLTDRGFRFECNNIDEGLRCLV